MTTVFLTALFLLFIAHRLFTLIDWDKKAETGPERVPALASGVICANIVNKMPFGVDSVFRGNSRLYFYTTLDHYAPEYPDSLRHHWYFGDRLVQDVPCALSENRCISSITPELLQNGEWSVDFVSENKLLTDRQFRIDAKGY
ncbi:MAG: DUF2914 domain-containing protein [Fibrobacter sp.]|jgi:hypothetical protein|nr:DUF2914 domain-containing protein [Fibrobacter sp.]